MFRDIGFEWGLQKCVAVEEKRGILTEGGNLTVSKEESMQIMSKDGHYKFLRTVENCETARRTDNANIKPRINSQAIRNMEK